MSAPVREEHVRRHHPLLGTVVEIRVVGDAATAAAVDRCVVAEIGRLEEVFSAFAPDSELNRWKLGEVDEPSPELSEVLAAALAWQCGSGGRFNPLAGVITAAWHDAETVGNPPSGLDALAASIAEPRYEIVGGRPVPTGDCSQLNLNAFAKGWIVDRALDVAVRECDVPSILVNAGGDLAHRGIELVRVGIENPLRPYDNEPPITTVELRGAGLATSGAARQGFRVGARRWSHVIDPRTGWPVEHQASISVLAPDAATADVAATVLGVLPPHEATLEAIGLGVACLVVAPDSAVTASLGWPTS